MAMPSNTQESSDNNGMQFSEGRPLVHLEEVTLRRLVESSCSIETMDKIKDFVAEMMRDEDMEDPYEEAEERPAISPSAKLARLCDMLLQLKKRNPEQFHLACDFTESCLSQEKATSNSQFWVNLLFSIISFIFGVQHPAVSLALQPASLAETVWHAITIAVWVICLVAYIVMNRNQNMGQKKLTDLVQMAQMTNNRLQSFERETKEMNLKMTQVMSFSEASTSFRVAGAPSSPEKRI
jgi:hypothetical protein